MLRILSYALFFVLCVVFWLMRHSSLHRFPFNTAPFGTITTPIGKLRLLSALLRRLSWFKVLTNRLMYKLLSHCKLYWIQLSSLYRALTEIVFKTSVTIMKTTQAPFHLNKLQELKCMDYTSFSSGIKKLTNF